MKVGILTFHNAHNYGAVLQAYALKEKIAAMGHEASLIDYRNPCIERNYQKKLTAKIRLFDLIHPGTLVKKIKFLAHRKTMQDAWAVQWERFEEFIHAHLAVGPGIASVKELLEEPYDALIVGSDQIWTSQLTGGLDPVYLLDFDYDGRKISYAAIINVGEIPQKEKELFLRPLKEFDFLSVRERSLSDSIYAQYHLQASVALDPTLLLEAYEYEPLLRQAPKMRGRYLFAYFVVEDPAMDASVRYVSERMGIARVELHYYKKKGFDPNTQFADFGPAEFLNAVANAEFVLTNSFHGTVFSVLFQKEFYSISKGNARIDNLLRALGLKRRGIEGPGQMDFSDQINFAKVQERLKEYRKESELFLCRALRET